MGTILTVANQKGGVGKTTTAINLGAALGALEQKVLLVDCDPQGNATRGVGETADGRHLYHALSGDCDLTSVVVSTSFPNLDLVPAGQDLVGVEVEFVGEPGWEARMKNAVTGVVDHYDMVLVDCPPSLGHLTVGALAAADGVLVPLQCEYFALEGISQLVGTVRRVQSGLNPRLDIAGILLTMYDHRTNLSRDVVDEARAHFGDRVFQTIIPRNVRLAEAPSYGKPVIQYDITCRGAEAYLALARELLERAA